MKNLIVAGIGGQGVNVLTKVLAEVLIESGFDCQFTVHKGGAQSLGTVYGEMRITQGGLPILGAGIPKGRLDYLIALDPWEALRHLPLAHARTQVWIETELQPIFNDRRSDARSAATRVDPIKQLNELPLSIQWRHYRREARDHNGGVKMANYLAGLDCLQALEITNKKRFERLFHEAVFPTESKESV